MMVNEALNYCSNQEKLCILEQHNIIAIEKIRVTIIYILFNNYKQLETIAFNCLDVCLYVQSVLYTKFGINSLLISGNLIIDNESLYSITKDKIREMHGKNNKQLPMHVWLSVGNYIIDPSILTTLLFSKQTIVNSKLEDKVILQNYLVACFELGSHKCCLSGMEFLYIPLLVGNKYYQDTSFTKSVIIP